MAVVSAKVLEVGNGCMAVLANVDNGDIISKLLGYGLYEDVFMVTCVNYNGIMYRRGLGLGLLLFMLIPSLKTPCLGKYIISWKE